MSTASVTPTAIGPGEPATSSPPDTQPRARRRVGLMVTGVVIAVLFTLPLWWTLVSALRPAAESHRALSPASIWMIIPRSVSLENFTRLLDGGFARPMANSLIVTVSTLVVGLLICAMAAFALAILRFRGRTAIFAIMVVSFLIPFDAIAIPLMTMFRGVGLDNTFLALVLPGIGNGIAVFLLRGFFLGIPLEIAEAAKMDGLGWLGIFWRIYVPLSRPALISAGLILFVFQWQAYLWPLLIAPNPDMMVAPVAIAQFAGQQEVDFGRIFAGAALTALVPLAILGVFQRYFTQSVTGSAVKG